MDNKQILKSLQRALQEQSNPERALAQQKYFKNLIDFRGIATPQLKIIFRNFRTHVKSLNLIDTIFVARELVSHNFFEDKILAHTVVASKIKELDGNFLRDWEAYFIQHVNNWGICDDFCSNISSLILKTDLNAPNILLEWSLHSNLWLKRAAAVSFVKHTNDKRFHPVILKIARNIVLTTSDRFAQLGMGWVMRYVYLSNSKEWHSFVETHYDQINREALRYLLEKTPASLRESILKR